MVKNLPAMQEVQVLIPGLGRSPAERNGNPLQYPCWRISWTDGPGGLQSTGSQRIGHDWATNTFTLFCHIPKKYLLDTCHYCTRYTVFKGDVYLWNSGYTVGFYSFWCYFWLKWAPDKMTIRTLHIICYFSFLSVVTH